LKKQGVDAHQLKKDYLVRKFPRSLIPMIKTTGITGERMKVKHKIQFIKRM
jgi:hypothetical protein